MVLVGIYGDTWYKIRASHLNIREFLTSIIVTKIRKMANMCPAIHLCCAAACNPLLLHMEHSVMFNAYRNELIFNAALNEFSWYISKFIRERGLTELRMADQRAERGRCLPFPRIQHAITCVLHSQWRQGDPPNLSNTHLESGFGDSWFGLFFPFSPVPAWHGIYDAL